MEADHLSQKLSQLSTRITTTKNNVADDASLLKEIHIDLEKLPDYLTKRNESFQQMLKQLLATTSISTSQHTEKVEELRIIALLIYKTMVIQACQHLWTHYLKAGTGQLILPSSNEPLPYATNVPLWPKEIKTMVQTKMQINQDNEYENCFNFVQHYMDELEKQLKKYQHELQTKVHHCKLYSMAMQRQMETYLQQNLTGLRREIEHQVELIRYDYHIHAIKLAYLSHQPNPFQVCTRLRKNFSARNEYMCLGTNDERRMCEPIRTGNH